eukprot:scaffold1374_cov175-Amphora_coffeaeformis.AAC.1
MPQSLLSRAIRKGTAQDVMHELLCGARVEREFLQEATKHGDAAEKVRVLMTHWRFGRNTCREVMLRAIVRKQTEIVRVLLHAGVDPNFLKKEYAIGDTPLHCAVSADAIEIVELLLDHNADIEIRDSAGNTALHCHTTHLVVRKLMERGANANQVNNAGMTPFHNVCFDGDLASAREMDRANPNFVANGETPLYRACIQGRWDVARWLVQERGANPKPRTKHPLFHVVEPSLSPAHLIGLGLDPRQTDAEGNTALHSAVTKFQDQDEVVWIRFIDELVSHAPDLVGRHNHAGKTALHVAAKLGNKPVIQLLVNNNHQGDLMAKDNSGRIPAFEALFHTLVADFFRFILHLMVSKTLDIDCKDENGWTMLHHAVFQDFISEAFLLLEHGANCNIPNAQGRLPLHMAGFPHLGETADGHSKIRSYSTYTDYDISGVLQSGGYDWGSENVQECDLQLLEKLIGGTSDTLTLDANGNLPFFLAASSFKLDQTFVMIQAVASQGLFGQIKCSPKRNQGEEEIVEERPRKKSKEDTDIVLNRSVLQVGDRIAVYWIDDEEYYSGKITKRNNRGGIEILYDDGVQQWLGYDESLLIKRVDDAEALEQKKQEIASIRVGDRLDVWWPMEKAFYGCTVSQINHSSNTPFYLVYDDEYEEWINLLSRKYSRMTMMV